MPRLIGVREVRFVVPMIVDGKATYVDPRGHKVEVVNEPIVIDHYKEFFERSLVRVRDQVKRCAEVGHTGVGGCISATPIHGIANGPTPVCERWLQNLEADCYSDERTMLVRIDIPITNEPHIQLKGPSDD